MTRAISPGYKATDRLMDHPDIGHMGIFDRDHRVEVDVVEGIFRQAVGPARR